jgi:hypothetical protein
MLLFGGIAGHGVDVRTNYPRNSQKKYVHQNHEPRNSMKVKLGARMRIGKE